MNAQTQLTHIYVEVAVFVFCMKLVPVLDLTSNFRLIFLFDLWKIIFCRCSLPVGGQVLMCFFFFFRCFLLQLDDQLVTTALMTLSVFFCFFDNHRPLSEKNPNTCCFYYYNGKPLQPFIIFSSNLTTIIVIAKQSMRHEKGWEKAIRFQVKKTEVSYLA